MAARKHASTLEESTVIERIARIVSSVRGTKPDYTHLAAELEHAIPFDVFGVVLLRHDRQAVRVTVCHREADVWAVSYHQHPLEDSMLHQVLHNPHLIVKDYPQGLDGLPATLGDALSRYHQLRSTLIAPLVVEGRVLGTLELGSNEIHTYKDPNLQRLVRAVVHVLAAAIEHAQLGGSAEIQDRQRQALKAVSSSLTSSKMELPTILEQIVSGVANALNVASAIFLLEAGEERLHLKAQSGLEETTMRELTEGGLLVTDYGIVGQTLKCRLPLVSQDICSDERFPESCAFFSKLGMHSIFSYPLVAGPNVYGALLLCSPETGGFTPLKADILSLFASQATVAIHNGMLLESARQRSRFHYLVEQLYQVHEQQMRGAKEMVDGDPPRETEEQVQHELALFHQVQQQTQQTFGVSFVNLLQFISDHLLTQDERNLRAIYSKRDLPPLHSEEKTQVRESAALPYAAVTGYAPHQEAFADTLSLLTQTAEAALVRAGMLGELGRLLMQLKQSTNWVNDAWFVVAPDGFCLYMNPAAETFCDMGLGNRTIPYEGQWLSASQQQKPSLHINQLFKNVLPRVRNADELQSYLQDFTLGTAYWQELRCAVVTEDRSGSVMHQLRQGEYVPQPLTTASSDYHYQFTRYPLYNQQGELEANALQIRNVTQQVHNERNMSALLSSVSHDLRTPLTTIKAAVTGLLEPNVPWSEQDRRAMLEDIDEETDHLTVLVDALVELSRIEMGALFLEKEWCDVVEVGHGALKKLERVVSGRRIHFQALHQLPLVYADHVQLERVFYNLIESVLRRNAEQAQLWVLLDVVKNEIEVLRVRVIDQNANIPEAERENLFQSLQRLRAYGNGLGLAICKGIIEAHQGHIWVEAAQAHAEITGCESGSCFIFTLPVHPHTARRTDENFSAVQEPEGSLPQANRLMGGMQS